MTAFFLRYSYVAIIQRAYLRLIVDIIRHARLYNLRVISGLSAKIPRSVSKKKEEKSFIHTKNEEQYIYILKRFRTIFIDKRIYTIKNVSRNFNSLFSLYTDATT